MIEFLLEVLGNATTGRQMSILSSLLLLALLAVLLWHFLR
jgi:hypothetical protein